MGQLISLTDRLAARALERVHLGSGPAVFFLALDCPVSYLVAERVERDLGEIAWTPMLEGSTQPWMHERLCRARDEATVMRLPLLEPDNHPFDVRPISRANLYAGRHGDGSRFALAALRLAFGGGFDLSDPDIIAEAAAAAGIEVDGALAAAADGAYDEELTATTRGLRRCGIAQGPALRICGEWFTGFDALTQTSGFTAARASYRATAAEPA